MGMGQVSNNVNTAAATRTHTAPRSSGGGGQSSASAAPQDTFTSSSSSGAGIYSPKSLSTAGSGGQAPNYAAGDPTLDHNNQVCDPQLSQRPLVAEGGRWNGSEILNAQSQLDTSGQQNNQESRCGPSAVVGGAVMQGPQATARLVERLSGKVGDQQSQQLEGIRNRILDGTATHQDLSDVQELAYQRYNTNGTAGLSTAEMTAMQRDLAGQVTLDPTGNTTNGAGERVVFSPGDVAEEPGRTTQRIGNLQPGESFTMGVDSSQSGANQFNHWVQVGRDENGDNYVYDPYPADNQPHVSRPSADGMGSYEEYADGFMGPIAPNGTQYNVIGGGTTKY